MPGEPDKQIINICKCFHIVIKYICDSSWIHREVSEKDAKDYADSIHAIFVETSAKNAININEVFIEISESNTWRLWPLTPCLRGAAFKAFHIRIRCFWLNLCSGEKGKKNTRCILKNLTVWELHAFCHQIFFPPVAHVSLSPFCWQSSCDPSSSEAAWSSPALKFKLLWRGVSVAYMIRFHLKDFLLLLSAASHLLRGGNPKSKQANWVIPCSGKGPFDKGQSPPER